MKTLSIAASTALIMAATGASAELLDRTDSNRARDALELHYLDRGIYSPVRCAVENDRSDDPRTWVFCYSVGGSGDIGGLFLGKNIDGESLKLWAINGKAIQHIGGVDQVTIEDMRGNPIRVERWRGELFDIPAILALF